MHRRILLALQVWWQNAFPLDVVTIYPGVRTETEQLAEWLELRLETWSTRTTRSGGQRLVDVLITFHCFTRPTLDAARLQTIADAVRETLQHQTLPIHDLQSSGQPVIGWLKLFEAETRDLTRPAANQQRHSLNHQLITIPALAQEF